MTTIIRLLVKGSELLNRLRQQQTSNRAGQAQKERDRRTEEERRKRVQQQRPAPVFAPDPQRRRIEPIATRKRKAPRRFWFSMLYLNSPTFTWPDGKVGRFYDPAILSQFKGEEGGVNTDDTEGMLFLYRSRFEQQLSQWVSPLSILNWYNQNRIVPSGAIANVQPRAFTYQDWNDFNNRMPFNEGTYKRLHVPFTASHSSQAQFTYVYSYVDADVDFNAASPAVITNINPPTIVTARTVPAGQAKPFTLFPFMLGPRGYGVAYSEYNDPGSPVFQTAYFFDVYAPGIIQEGTPTDTGGLRIIGAPGDEEGGQIVFSVGDKVRVAAKFRPPSFFGDQTTIDQANRFMSTYWNSEPHREYTILSVQRTSTYIRYQINEARYAIENGITGQNGAHWPGVVSNILDYYLIRSCDSWEQVIPEETYWDYDDGVPAASMSESTINNGYQSALQWYIVPGSFNSIQSMTTVDYKLESVDTTANKSGLPLYRIGFDSSPQLGDWIETRLATTSATTSILDNATSFAASIPSDWLDQDQDYWLWRGGINNDQSAYVLELAKERTDPEAQAGRPSQLTFYKVEIPIDVLKPIWERTDLGFSFVGTVAYIPPSG